MAKITHFGTISELGGQLHFDGFCIDPEGDDTVGYHTIYDDNTTSITSNPHKVIDVIIAGVIERLSALRESNKSFVLARASIEQVSDYLTPISETDPPSRL